MVPGTFFSRALCFSMISYNCCVWNVRGLNGRARRNVVRDLVTQEHATLVCLQEPKLSVICNSLAYEIQQYKLDAGRRYYAFLAAEPG